jgi:riboflavin kinase
MIIKGTVTGGLGEGSRFLMKEGYVKQFRKKLGFVPYPGTLNIRTEMKLPDNPTCAIEGFTEDGNVYGRVLCYRARLIHGTRREECFIVRPALATDDGIVELVHKENLRRRMDLKDEEEVGVEILP